MTPQSSFMVAAPIAPGREAGLRALLATMNTAPGVVDPHNALVPFGGSTGCMSRDSSSCTTRRWTISRPYGTALPKTPPVWLVFLGDCDGPAETMLAEFAAIAGAGLAPDLRPLRGLRSPDGDLLAWMQAHVRCRAAAVRELGRPHGAADPRGGGAARGAARAGCSATPRGGRGASRATSATGWSPPCGGRAAADAAGADAARLALPQDRQPDRRAAGAAGAAAVLIVLCAVLLLGIAPAREVRCGASRRARTRSMCIALSVLEDHDVTNQFSAFGSVKPGRFRLWTLIFIFWVLSFSTRHIYTRGRLARVGTIHFARWVFMDDQPRGCCSPATMTAASTATWTTSSTRSPSASISCSATASAIRAREFLLSGGAKDEQAFKNYLRRHQVPTQVWYKAYPGPHRRRPGTQHAHPRRAASADDDRGRGARMAGADLSRPSASGTSSPTSRACCGPAMAALTQACFLLLRVADAAAARAWLRGSAGHHRGGH